MEWFENLPLWMEQGAYLLIFVALFLSGVGLPIPEELSFLLGGYLIGSTFAARRAGVPHVWFVHEILDGKNPLLSHILGRRALVRRMDKLAVRIIANDVFSNCSHSLRVFSCILL